MPVTIYARLEDLLQTTDPDIGAALAGLKRAPVVQEMPHHHPHTPTRWWHFSLCPRTPLEVGYRILWPIVETPLGREWQIVQFYRAVPTTPSTSTVVSKELVLAYLYGCAVDQERGEP
jgi:hypothetical protein